MANTFSSKRKKRFNRGRKRNGTHPTSPKRKLINSLGEELHSKFKEKGLYVRKKKSSISNSVYVDIEHGLGGKIRISDHAGSNEKYNIYFGYNGNAYAETDKDGKIFYVYPFDEKAIDLILHQVERDVEMLKISLGNEEYYKQREESRKKSIIESQIKRLVR